MVIYSFLYYCENNSTEMGLFDSVAAVDFCDVNNDNIKDVIVIINYVTGAGPQGMTPRPRARNIFAFKITKVVINVFIFHHYHR